MNTIKDIKNHINNANIVEKLIYINVAIFIIVVLSKAFMMAQFSLPSNLEALGEKPWTIATYAFIHTRLFHILSNLIILYFIGNLFLDFFSSKKFLLYYLVGLLFGGLLFVVYYALSNEATNSTLIGASAAVTAVFIGVAAKAPHYALKLRFVGSVELWVLAAIWVFLSAIGTAGVNAGSGIAHLGGAAIGYLMTTYFAEGDGLLQIFSRKPKKTPFTKVYRNPTSTKTKSSHTKRQQNQRKVDRILDKISKSGYEALTKDEKDFLFNQKEDNS